MARLLSRQADIGARLASHLSLYQLRGVLDREDVDPTSWSELNGAVLFLDISGFTELTARLGEQGRRGAERLSELLDDCFGAIVQIGAAHGGDALFFGGDSVLLLFEAHNDGPALDGATALACQAALAVQERLRGVELLPGFYLWVRASIACGSLATFEVGGHRDRWLRLYGGPAIHGLFSGDKRCEPGQVVVAGPAWKRVAKRCTRSSADADGYALLESVDTPEKLPGPPTIEVDFAGPEMTATLRRYLLEVVGDRVAAGVADFLAEFRTLSVVYVNLPDQRPATADDVAPLHSAARAIQHVVDRHDGELFQMLWDDKGISALAVFGLPLHSHDDDATRATEAAQAIRAEAARLGLTTAIGVATGQMYCGEIGGEDRRNYGLLGPAINLSARLMTATGGDGLLCDQNTRRGAARHLDFDEQPAVRVKGVAEPVPVWVPSGSRRRAERERRELVGRVQEIELLTERLARARDDHQGGSLVFEAEAGMGKSTLFHRGCELAAVMGLPRLVGAADPIETNTPFFALRAIVFQLLDLEPEADPEAARSRALEVVQASGASVEHAPLLNAILSLDLPESALTEQMDGQTRADNLAALLVRMVAARAGDGGLLVALEDLHWLDAASRRVFVRIARQLPGVLLLMTSRPLEPRPADLQELVASGAAEWRPLSPLGPEETVELVKRRLGATRLPEELERLISERGGGNPLFSEEIALSLRDENLIEVRDGEVVLTDRDLTEAHIPATVQGAITARIDRLEAGEAVTLKVASVVGRLFEDRVLSSIHPTRAAEPVLRDQLETLRAANFIVPEPAADAHLFRHALTHQATYDLLAYAQRKALNQATAEYIESAHADDLDQYHPRLAWHWREAEVPDRAVRHLALAGKQALQVYANQAAADFLDEALQLDLGLRGPLRRDEDRARWEHWAGEAQFKMARHEETKAHFLRSLGYWGITAPRNALTKSLDLCVATARHALHLALPVSMVAGTEEAVERQRTASMIYQRLSEIAFFNQDLVSLMHGTFRNLNHAELSGDPDEIAPAYGTVAIVAGLFMIHPVARLYSRWSIEAGDRAPTLTRVAYAHLLKGVYYYSVGNGPMCEAGFARGMEDFERLGDRPRWETCVCAWAFHDVLHGRLDQAIERCDAAMRSVGYDGTDKIRVWALSTKLYAGLSRGPADPDELALLETALTRTAHDLGDTIMGQGVCALAHIRAGNLERAKHWAEACATSMRNIPPTPPFTSFGVSAYHEVCVLLMAADPENRSTWSWRAWWAGTVLHVQASQNPVLWDRARYCAARYREALGKGSAARAYRSVAAGAGKRGKAWEVALAAAGIARLEPTPAHLAEAREKLGAMGNTWEVDQLPASPSA